MIPHLEGQVQPADHDVGQGAGELGFHRVHDLGADVGQLADQALAKRWLVLHARPHLVPRAAVRVHEPRGDVVGAAGGARRGELGGQVVNVTADERHVCRPVARRRAAERAKDGGHDITANHAIRGELASRHGNDALRARLHPVLARRR